MPCIDDGIIKEYKDATFLEYVTTYDPNLPIKDEDGQSYYFPESTQIVESVKREIIYVVE